LAIEGRAAWWALRPLFGFYTRGISHSLGEGVLRRECKQVLGVGGGSVAKRKMIAPGRGEQQTTTKRDQTTTNKHCIAA
jgi:hypothetical protein